MLDNSDFKKFSLFLLAGGIAAAVNFFSRMVYSFWFGFSSAVIFAYLTGMLTAFVLFRVFVFSNSNSNIRRSVFFFVVVNCVAIVQTWAVTLLMAYYFLPSVGVTILVHEIAHAIGIAVPVVTSYLGHKHWSFK